MSRPETRVATTMGASNCRGLSLRWEPRSVMNKPRILMIWLSAVIRNALLRGLPTWREKVGLGTIVLAMLVVAAVLSPGWDLRKPIQAKFAYWQKPLMCRGADFREPPPDTDSAPDEPRCATPIGRSRRAF